MSARRHDLDKQCSQILSEEMLLGETNSFTGVKKKRNKEDMSSDKYIYSIDQGWGKDGRILAESFFFFCTIMDLDFISVHEKNKKGMRAISSYLDRNKLDQQRKGLIIKQ